MCYILLYTTHRITYFDLRNVPSSSYYNNTISRTLIFNAVFILMTIYCVLDPWPANMEGTHTHASGAHTIHARWWLCRCRRYRRMPVFNVGTGQNMNELLRSTGVSPDSWVSVCVRLQNVCWIGEPGRTCLTSNGGIAFSLERPAPNRCISCVR